MKLTMYNYQIKISYGASSAWKLDFEVTFRKLLSNVEWGFSGFLFYILFVMFWIKRVRKGNQTLGGLEVGIIKWGVL
jgi:hypothetical protein